MAIDFRKIMLAGMTPERRLEYLAYEERHQEEVERWRAMDAETLCNSLEYFLSQCQEPRRWGPGVPVYDAVVWHVVIPELIRRLRNG